MSTGLRAPHDLGSETRGKETWSELLKTVASLLEDKDYVSADRKCCELLDLVPASHRDVPLIKSYLAQALTGRERFWPAKQLDFELIDLATKHPAGMHAIMNDVLLRRLARGHFHQGQGDHKEAKWIFEYAFQAGEAVLGASHPVTRKLWASLQAVKEIQRAQVEADARQKELARLEEDNRRETENRKKQREEKQGGRASTGALDFVMVYDPTTGVQRVSRDRSVEGSESRKRLEYEERRRREDARTSKEATTEKRAAKGLGGTRYRAAEDTEHSKTGEAASQGKVSRSNSSSRKSRSQAEEVVGRPSSAPGYPLEQTEHKNDGFLSPNSAFERKPGRSKSVTSGADLTADAQQGGTETASMTRANSTGHQTTVGSRQQSQAQSRYEAEYFDVSLLGADALGDNKTDRWFDRHLKKTQNFVNDGPRSWRKERVRIAILDTGFNSSHPEAAKLITDKDRRKPGVKAWKSWVGGTGLEDPDGHGTHCAMTLAKVADEAEIYIARVFEDGDHAQSDHVEAAVMHAIREWKVHIISMSFGFDNSFPALKIEEALNEAARQDTLLFAAASNSGRNEGRTFPATHKPVFCVHSTDGDGRPSGFNPDPHANQWNFTILGERVSAPHRDQETVRLSGTSVATPIAAGVAAQVLEFLSQDPCEGQKKLNESEMKKLRSRDGMESVFLCMKDSNAQVAYEQKALFYLRPWKFLAKGAGMATETEDQARIRVSSEISRALEHVRRTL